MKDGMARGAGELRALSVAGYGPWGGYLKETEDILFAGGNMGQNISIGSTRLSGLFRHVSAQPWDS